MRQGDARVTLRVQRTDGSWRDCGVFHKREGGKTVGDETKFFPGGGMPQETLVGPPTTENVTVTKVRRSTDIELQRWLRTRVGAIAEAIEAPLDPDGNAFAVPEVYRGKVLAVTPPEHEAGASATADLVVEISTAGSVG